MAPHASEARQLLERLKTNPGIVVILRSRELVVGTLGEMDPVDDRIMQMMQLEGGECLLGYNTNSGLGSARRSERTILESSFFYCFISSTNINECPYSLIHCLCFCVLCDVPKTLCRRRSAFARLQDEHRMLNRH